MESAEATIDLDPLHQIAVSDVVAAIPKVDLHVHAETGPRIDRLINPSNGFDWPDWMRRVMSEYSPGIERLNQLATNLTGPEQDADPEIFLARTEDLLRESADNGAIYTEVRFGRETHLRSDFIELFRMAEERVATKHNEFIAEPLVTVVARGDRSDVDRLLQHCIDIAKDGLAGVDLIPDPYTEEADWDYLVAWCDRIATAGLGLTIHAGEFSISNAASAISAPGVTRIGHGIHIASHPSLVESVVKQGVALEVCLSSNVVLGAVRSYAEHPVKNLFAAGVDVTINTDNPVHFQTTIGREYEIANRVGLTDDDLRQVSESAIRHSFTSDKRRTRLAASLDARSSQTE